MDETKVGLYDAKGAEIISYDKFDSGNVHYLYACTGWNAVGEWEMTQPGVASVVIDRSDTTYTTHNSLGGSAEPKEFGTAGDCFSWNSCSDARKGTFNIDFGDKADIDWVRTGFWEGSGWGNGNFMVDFDTSPNSATARCGGWCGECKPTTDIFLAPVGKGPVPIPGTLLSNYIKNIIKSL